MNEKDFDRFLAWLDPSRDKAEKRYIEIQRWLIKVFRARGCAEADAEDLTEKTINRIVGKMAEIAATYVGPREAYFCKVAHYVFLEHIRPRSQPLPQPLPEPWDEKEPRYACLDHCMMTLKEDDRRMAQIYYADDGRAKIEQRRKLAEELGGSNALRIRMYRIRESLHGCITECLKREAD